MVLLPGLRLEMRPARLGRHPEDVLGAVLVGILRIGALILLGFQPRVHFLERIGDVFEEDQAQDDVIVFGGIHAAAERVCHAPEFGFIADIGGGGVGPRGPDLPVDLGHLGGWCGCGYPCIGEGDRAAASAPRDNGAFVNQRLLDSFIDHLGPAEGVAQPSVPGRASESRQRRYEPVLLRLLGHFIPFDTASLPQAPSAARVRQSQARRWAVGAPA